MHSLALLLVLAAGDGDRVATPRTISAPPASPAGVTDAKPAVGKTNGAQSPTQDPASLARYAADLQSDDIDVREGAVEQLVCAEKALVIPLVRSALSSEKEPTRIVAVKVLRRIQASTVSRDLARLLDRDRSELVRREACHALVDCAPKEAPNYLLDAARDDRAVVVRRAAINDLGRLATVDAADALVQILQQLLAEEDEYLLNHTTQALTLATDQLHGRNLEGWQHHVAAMRRAENEKLASGEVPGGAAGAKEIVIEPVKYVPPSGEN